MTKAALRTYIEKYIKNSSVEAFTNLRLQTALLEMTDDALTSSVGDAANTTALQLLSGADFTYVIVTGSGIYEYSSTGTANGTTIFAATGGGTWNQIFSGGASGAWGSITGTLSAQTDLQNALNAKQATLVSATNIKTVNSTSLLGSGDVAVQPTLVSGTNIKTINGTSVLGSGDLTVGGGGGGGFWSETGNTLYPTTAGRNIAMDVGVASAKIHMKQVNALQLFNIYEPFNSGTDYGSPNIGIAGYFTVGCGHYPGVNGDGRPNVVGQMWAYNVGNSGSRLDPSDAGFRYSTETHYQIGNPHFEMHTPEIMCYNGTTIRINSYYIDKVTGSTFNNRHAYAVNYFRNVDNPASAAPYCSIQHSSFDVSITLAANTGTANHRIGMYAQSWGVNYLEFVPSQGFYGLTGANDLECHIKNFTGYKIGNQGGTTVPIDFLGRVGIVGNPVTNNRLIIGDSAQFATASLTIRGETNDSTGGRLLHFTSRDLTDHASAYCDGSFLFNMNGGRIGIGYSSLLFVLPDGSNHISVKTGTAPTASPVDGFVYYSADLTAGNAVPHFRTEAGDIIRLAANAGWGTPSGTLTRTTFDPSTVTLSQLAERLAALITDLKTTNKLLTA